MNKRVLALALAALTAASVIGCGNVDKTTVAVEDTTKEETTEDTETTEKEDAEEKVLPASENTTTAENCVMDIDPSVEGSADQAVSDAKTLVSSYSSFTFADLVTIAEACAVSDFNLADETVNDFTEDKTAKASTAIDNMVNLNVYEDWYPYMSDLDFSMIVETDMCTAADVITNASGVYDKLSQGAYEDIETYNKDLYSEDESVLSMNDIQYDAFGEILLGGLLTNNSTTACARVPYSETIDALINTKTRETVTDIDNAVIYRVDNGNEIPEMVVALCTGDTCRYLFTLNSEGHSTYNLYNMAEVFEEAAN